MIEFFPSRTIAVELFGFGVHWYGLLYLAGFLIGWYLLPRLQRYRDLNLSKDEWSRILTAAILGVIVGGRLGYVLLYDPAYYLAHPVEILYVWQGGMASHGGFIGVTLALMYVLRDRRSQWLQIADVVVVPIAIGLALGRIGNVINQELYGSVTTLPWGTLIPGVEGARHPTAAYAVLQNFGIAALCFVHLRRASSITGRTVALFFLFYGMLRFCNEFLRVPTHSSFDIGLMTLTRGQLYSIPLILIGMTLWIVAARRHRA